MASPLTRQLGVSVQDSSEGIKNDLAQLRLRLRAQAAARGVKTRLDFARAATATVVFEFWNTLIEKDRAVTLRLAPLPAAELSDESLALFGRKAASLPTAQAFFEIGELYTTLLPDDYRTQFGVYYTPPSLVERLLDVVEAEGADWSTARILDPACGGAAFAAFVAERMLAANASLRPEARLHDLKDRLVGIELDPFAAWLAEVFLDVVCLPLVQACGRRVEGLIRTGDTLLQPESEMGEFDLIVGNPPYGKVTLPDAQRQRFKRSLFGHANIYGIFTDLAVRHTKRGGLIGFVTPTSFLGGEYFKNLRGVLLQEAPPVHATFIADREGVFSGVLQETMLAVFRRHPLKRQRTKSASSVRTMKIEVMQPHHGAATAIRHLGKVELSAKSAGPWILPRDSGQSELIRVLAKMPGRLADHGYRSPSTTKPSPVSRRLPTSFRSKRNAPSRVNALRSRKDLDYGQLQMLPRRRVNESKFKLISQTLSHQDFRRGQPKEEL